MSSHFERCFMHTRNSRGTGVFGWYLDVDIVVVIEDTYAIEEILKNVTELKIEVSKPRVGYTHGTRYFWLISKNE